MKFRCERDILADAINSTGRAATNRTGALPVLSGIHLAVSGDQLTLTGTDLELTIRLAIEVGGEQDGSTVVPARLVGDIVRSLPAGAVEVELVDSDTGSDMSIVAGRSQFFLRPLALDDYPVQTEPIGDFVTLAGDTMAAALRQVVRAASTDDARAVLTGVLLASEEEAVRMVATDSYRLAVRDLPDSDVLSSGQKVLIPGRALSELQRLLDDVDQLTVRFGELEATFEAAGTRLSTRLIEGDFPNYRNLLPSSYPNLLTVSKAAMLEAIKRVKILAQDSTPVKLSLADSTVELTAVTQDVGNASEEIDAIYNGAEMTVAFNPDYLASGIDAIDADDVTLALLDPMKPAVLRGIGQEDYLYLLMPVRVH